MNRIVISMEGCIKNQSSIDEVLMLLLYYYKTDQDRVQELLISKGFITAERDSFYKQIGWKITAQGVELLNSVIIDSDKSERSDNEFLILAEKLKEIFPAGKKEGTNNYWTEGKALIVKRLKTFFKKYDADYTDEQIIEATKKYVEGFNGNYQFMKTLKYFIFKDKIVDNEKEYSSDLLNYLENAGEENILSDDWNTELI